MVAPPTNGTYQSNWKLRNPQGQYFGIGPDGISAFWVRVVVASEATLIPSPTTAVQVSGPATLVINDTLDLDLIQTNTPGADLSYLRIDLGDQTFNHQLLPLGDARLILHGSSPPNLETCQSSDPAAAPVTIETLSLGSYLCYQTNDELPGWLRIETFNPENGNLGITILTWSLP